MIRALATLACALAAFTACGHAPRSATDRAVEKEFGKRFVQERAAFDMKCPQGQVQVAYLGTDGDTPKYGARGCEQQCTYKVRCDDAGSCEALDAACPTTAATGATP